jgi:hypothetical protein
MSLFNIALPAMGCRALPAFGPRKPAPERIVAAAAQVGQLADLIYPTESSDLAQMPPDLALTVFLHEDDY